ncbi:MAG: VWA domain-containing protein [Myxococcales bacterium]|nr:VWA domain-containing protein [Myxococcales bacterium]MCB9754065.1 VWA domain-containing protein [Myxococcales bacterium]
MDYALDFGRYLTALLGICTLAGVGAGCGDNHAGTDSDGSITGATTASGPTTDSPTSSAMSSSDATTTPGGSEGDSESTTGSSDTTDSSTDAPTTETTETTVDPSTSSTDDPSATTSPWMPMPCQVETTLTEPAPSNVLFVLDKSGSMSMEMWDHDSDPQTPTVTRWKSLYQVVEFVVTEFNDTINFGAKLFPKYDAGSYLNEGACEVMPGIEVPIAEMNAPAVLDGIPGPDFEVLGGTPVYSGLVEAYDYLKGLDDSIPRAVILVADGEISCNESDIVTMMAVEQAWSGDDIGTYVVGIDAKALTEAQLNLYAEVGGKPNPDGGPILFYQTFNQDDLKEAMQKIVYDTISCKLPVNPAPDQPELFEVWIDGGLIPEVEDCDDEDGWVWLKPDHTALQLCGAACQDFKVAGEFEAKYWCTPE